MHSHPEFTQLDLVQSPVFVLEVTPQGEPVYAAFNSFGLAMAKRPLSDFLGHSALHVYRGAFGKTAFARHMQVVQTGQALSYELTIPLAGQDRQVRKTLTPVLDASGKVTFIYGSIFDISAERRVNELEATLQTLDSEVEQFISMAAHDLRAPMRNVSQLADMLRDDFEDQGDGKLHLLNMLEEVATKSTTLISDILAHANATATQARIKTFLFADLCREICDVLDPHGDGLYTFTTTSINTDHAVLQIALRNIFENAIKNCDAEQLHLDISVCQIDDGFLQVKLQDNGAGFSAPALSFFDDGSFRVDSGYGLLGVKRLLTTRGGRISAYNDPQNGGGVVEFTLPGTLSALPVTMAKPAQHLVLPQHSKQSQGTMAPDLTAIR